MKLKLTVLLVIMFIMKLNITYTTLHNMLLFSLSSAISILCLFILSVQIVLSFLAFFVFFFLTHHKILVLIPVFTFTDNFPRGTILKIYWLPHKKVKLHHPYLKFQLSYLRRVSNYSGIISQQQNTTTVFHFSFTFMTSIIIFYQIYSEVLLAIQIRIITSLLSFFLNTLYGQ